MTNLSHCLTKASSNADLRQFKPDAFIALRLAPDMLPFAAQIRIACDASKNATARVSGLEALKFSDDENTFGQLQERIAKTLVCRGTMPPNAFDGREAQDITLPAGEGKTRTLSG